MIEYQQDDDGVIRCRHREASVDGDPHSVDFCSKFKDYCLYSADCRVPIPTLLSEVAMAAENLVETSENLVELMVDLGYDRVGSYREDLDAARKDLDAARAILEQEPANGQK